jgi:hypothetical protein
VRQAVKEYLTYNHEVTDTDRDGLGIPIHKTTHTPAPVATEASEADIDTSVIGRLIIAFSSLKRDTDTKRQNPPDSTAWK